MSIAERHLSSSHQLVEKQIEGLRDWCRRQGLDPNTIKRSSSLKTIPTSTALGFIEPRMVISLPDLTAVEKELGASNEIASIPKITVADIDGVIKRRGSPLQAELQNFEETAKRVNFVNFWTSRVAADKNGFPLISIFCQNLSPEILANFPFLTKNDISYLVNHYPPEKQTIVVHSSKVFANGIKQITDLVTKYYDPYVVFIGSSIFDIDRFKKVIEELRKRELPFDRTVFCIIGVSNFL